MVFIQVEKKFSEIDVSAGRLKNLVKAICDRFGVSDATIGITIVDNAQIRKLNCEFLGHNRVTDCLSFDLSEATGPQTGKTFDLIVNGQLALRQGKLRGHTAEAELALYITHCMLHNLGFDDSTRKRAEKMHDTEDDILKQFGYGAVYKKPRGIIT